jgi:hypothetical protein
MIFGPVMALYEKGGFTCVFARSTKACPDYFSKTTVAISSKLYRNDHSVASRTRDCAICAYFMQIAHFNEVNARQVAHLTIF